MISSEIDLSKTNKGYRNSVCVSCVSIRRSRIESKQCRNHGFNQHIFILCDLAGHRSRPDDSRAILCIY